MAHSGCMVPGTHWTLSCVRGMASVTLHTRHENRRLLSGLQPWITVIPAISLLVHLASHSTALC